ncbi:beta-N-acetylhexosaminidase [Thalassotalea atypica]|uniref:beta-N-acetylhexosaminidase n=1 Tax=Thalassotalea atypica TaxID=2054316 RepID=UPI002574257D|nr:beta-N-acetylhexosaminidase [Thalassotalea atypica]
MGPLMMDVQGTSLTQEDREILAHPLVGGLILFTRNYQDPKQVSHLTQQIRLAAGKDILISVDHEGGRVQRFREQFSAIPAMGNIWTLAQQNVNKAIELCFHAGLLMALEVSSVGIDISFAPVLDINDISDVIGDRAFHQSPEIVSQLASSFIKGMHQVGMKATGKHFPGHGSVKEDSHFALPVDRRSREEIIELDMLPFVQINQQGLLDAVMPAHVIYPAFDELSVGFSPFWLQQVLRSELGFDGVVFSDDLSMTGAASIGGFVERAEAAQQAGCDMLLVCNDRNATIEILDNANISVCNQSQRRLRKMLTKTLLPFDELRSLKEWTLAREMLKIG